MEPRQKDTLTIPLPYCVLLLLVWPGPLLLQLCQVRLHLLASTCHTHNEVLHSCALLLDVGRLGGCNDLVFGFACITLCLQEYLH